MAKMLKIKLLAFDKANEHAEYDIVVEKAKRLVECGYDVVILLDSITDLQGYNTTPGKSLVVE